VYYVGWVRRIININNLLFVAHFHKVFSIMFVINVIFIGLVGNKRGLFHR
jgi:hypothetical protein